MLHNFAFKNRLHHLCAAAIAIFSCLLSGDECKAVIKTLESKSPAITPSNGQYQTAGMFCQMSRKLHKITDHRTYSSAMYFLPAGSILLFQRFLPYDSKDIICDHCQLQHQFVALKLSRRESFNIHVRLDFTVILLTFSVGMVKINDCFVWQGSVCPVCAQFYIGYDKILPISVNGSFRDLINCAYSDSFLLVIRKGICHIPEGLSGINSFPITWMLDILAAFPDGFQPFFFTFLSGIPFYDEKHIVVFIAFFHKDAYVFRCIVAGIQPDEQWFFRQLSAQFNGLSQEIRNFFLAVLFPNPQFKIDEVSFRADICHNWCISVKTLVDTGYAFLIGFRIVKGGVHQYRQEQSRYPGLSALCAFHAACRHLPAGCLCAGNPRSCQNAGGVFRRKESHRRCLMRICSSQGHPSFHGQPHTGVFPDRAYQYR